MHGWVERRRRLPMTLLVAGLALVAALGSSAAATSASVAPAPPRSVVAPGIAGVALVGQTLTASSGSWSGDAPIEFQYQWQRCQAGGSSCAPIVGAFEPTYLVGEPDVGATIRVQVTAADPAGSASALSAATAPVAATIAAAASRLPDGTLSLPAADVAPPDRLVVEAVQVLPARPFAGRAFRVRVQIGDAEGYRIRGAVVSVTAAPAALAQAPATSTTTGPDGTVLVQLRAGQVAVASDLDGTLLVRAGASAGALAESPATSVVPLRLQATAPASPAVSPYASGLRGYDLSYPNCDRPWPREAGFAIVGVNGGRPFTFNRCLQQEYGWAAGVPHAVYLNSGYAPGLRHWITPACALAGSARRGPAASAYAIGCSEAATSFERVTLLALPAPAVWWIDVEPSNQWSPNRRLNAEVIQGLIDFLQRLSTRPLVGVYSRPSWWREISGGFVVTAPEWIPQRGDGCPAPFSHGPVWLSQGGSAELDLDRAC
jgi:hypothetical protein